MSIDVRAMGMVLLTILLIGCSKSNSSTTGQASASASPSAPEGTAQSAAPYGQGTLPPPASSDVHPFSAAALIAAYAALPGSAPTQADAVSFALMSTQTDLACDNVKKDFTDKFATHRNADRYMPFLKSSAKAMGLSSVDLPTNLGQYDFDSKTFPISSDYGNGTSFSINWSRLAYSNTLINCYLPSGPTMPDGSTVYYAVTLEADNGDHLHSYPLDPGHAETFQKTANQYYLMEHLVFYPVAISQRANGQIGAVVHVTKVLLEQRLSGAPITAVPTILMSTDLQ